MQNNTNSGVSTASKMTHAICGSLSRRLVGVLSISALLASSLAATPAASEEKDGQHWVGTWSTALHEPDLGVPGLSNAGFTNQTLRQIVHTSIGGHQVRVRLSTFGASGLVIGAAHIALVATGSATVPGSDRTLTFGGRASITIPPGASVVSDPMGLEVPTLGELAVSVFLPGKTGPATWHFESRQTSYLSSPGDYTGSTVMPADPTTPTMVAWFWLAGVEVMATKQTGAILALGDSITDGTQATLDANHRWPDELARRLMAQPGNQKMGVLNEGIAGSRLLRDSLGPNALARFDRDVLAQTGVTHVIVHMGGNDIFALNPAEEVTVEEIIQGHKQLIERAHTSGLKIYGCTLTPLSGFVVPGTPFPVYSAAKEAKRQAFNAWIRTSGEYDGLFDFDQVLRDPNSPARLLPLFDSGDHGHPTDAGYKALAGFIELKLFRTGKNQ